MLKKSKKCLKKWLIDVRTDVKSNIYYYNCWHIKQVIFIADDKSIADRKGAKKLLPYRYSNSDQKEILNSLKILVDTREKKNNHITNYFNQKGIEFKNKKLNYGDYSFILPANKELSIERDIYFNNQISIERKASLNELSNNFTHDRSQFENELIRSNNGKITLMIENVNGYENILQHNYNTEYRPKSYIGTLHSFRHRYNIDVIFVDPKYSGNFIYYSFYYYLREAINN